MVSNELTTPDACRIYLRQRIERNIQYWDGFVRQHGQRWTVLETSQTNLVKAIKFGLDVPEAWEGTQRLILRLTKFMERREQWETWHAIIERGLSRATQVGDTSARINLLVIQARLARRAGRWQAMCAEYQQLLRLCRLSNDHYNLARTCTNLGYYFVVRGFLWRGEILCCHAWDIFQALQNRHGLAHTHNHLGVLYTQRQQWKMAGTHLEEACAIWQAQRDEAGLVHGYINLGVLYLQQSQTEAAADYFARALELARRIGDIAGEADAHLNQGVLCRQVGQLLAGEQSLLQAERLYLRLQDTQGLVDVWGHLAFLSAQAGFFSQAAIYCQRAQAAARKLDWLPEETRVLLEDVHQAGGDWPDGEAV